MRRIFSLVVAAFLFATWVSPPRVWGQPIVPPALTIDAITQLQSDDAQGEFLWAVRYDIPHNHAYLYGADGKIAAHFQPNLDSAWSAVLNVSFENGVLTGGILLTQARFDDTGYSASASLVSASLIPARTLIISAYNPFQAQYGDNQVIHDVYFGLGNYIPVGLDTSGSTFAGLMATFDAPQSSLHVQFSLDQALGGGMGQVWVMGMSGAPVPEPSTYRLFLLGFIGLMALQARRKTRVAVR